MNAASEVPFTRFAAGVFVDNVNAVILDDVMLVPMNRFVDPDRTLKRVQNIGGG